MQIRSFILIACIFSSCGKTPEHVRKCDQVEKAFAKILEKEEKFSLLGAGGIYGKETIDQFYIDFEVEREVSFEEARILVQKVARQFIEYIHQKEEILPYLAVSSLSFNDISISIAFVDTNRQPRKELSQVELCHQEIIFSTYHAKEKQYIFLKKEPFSSPL
jgi:hypothetical protein